MFDFVFKKIKIFSLFGIPLYIHMSWILFTISLFGFTLLYGKDILILAYYPLMFLFIIMHEYGHCLAAKYLCKTKVDDIVIYPIGGLAKIELDVQSRYQELVITLFGPLVNLVIGLIFVPFLFLPYENVASFASIVITINAVLLAFNILPIFPMDGGRILRSSLQYFGLSFKSSTILSGRISQFFAVILGVLFLVYFYNVIGLLIMMMMFFAAQSEIKRIKDPSFVLYENIEKSIHAVAIRSNNINVLSDYLVFFQESKLIEDKKFRKEHNLDLLESIIENELGQICYNAKHCQAVNVDL